MKRLSTVTNQSTFVSRISISTEGLRVLVSGNKNNVLFIVPGNSIDTPSFDGFLGDKFDFIYEDFLNNGWNATVVIDVYTKKPRGKAKYNITSLAPRFFLWVLFTVIRNPFRTLKQPKPLTFINQGALQATYQELVVKTKSKTVLAIGASEALVRACKSVGIPCVEIQHGIFNTDSLRSYWPGGEHPDMLLTWDRHSEEIANEISIATLTMGYSATILNSGRPSIERPRGPHVCVSLGYWESASEDKWGCFPPSIANSIDLLIRKRVPVIIRIHPRIAAQPLQVRLLKGWIHRRFESVRVDDPRIVPLRQSIADSFMNLAFGSSTWFEFAYSGMPTVLFHPTLASEFSLHASELGIWQSEESPIFQPTSDQELLDFVLDRSRSHREIRFNKSHNVADFIRTLKLTGI